MIQTHIDRLLQDSSLTRRMGEAGAKLMREAFSVDAMVEGNLALDRQLLNKDPANHGVS